MGSLEGQRFACLRVACRVDFGPVKRPIERAEPARARLSLAALVLASLPGLLGCPETARLGFARDVGHAAGDGVGTGTSSVGVPNTFTELRSLLREDPVGSTRAHLLAPKVGPLCTSPELRAAFLRDTQGALGREGPESRRAAEDVVEYVATACFRTNPGSGLVILAEAALAIPSPTRWDVLRARLLAADGRSVEARPFAEAAMNAGSVHARALLANILAEDARAQAPGYREGMFDAALQVAGAEPDSNWPLIDLTAVLSTRARLLSERAFYESSPKDIESLKAARAVYERLGLSPFPQRVRGLALDTACVDAVTLGENGFAACARAAELHGHLGAAFLAGRGEDPARFDLPRLEALKQLRLQMQSLGPKHLAVIAFRGDETELVSWGYPLSELLQTLAAQKLKLVSYVRGGSPRLPALAARVFERAGVRPALELRFPSGVEGMPCVAALIAKQPAPAQCALSADERGRLQKLGQHGIAVLVGRDLDAEIEDLRARDLALTLLSFRQPATERPVAAHLKSLSDVFLLSNRAKSLGGSMQSRPDEP